MGKFNNKIAVVTGGNSGIGYATAQDLLAQGAKVIITGRNQESINTAVASLGAGATGILADAANLAQTESLVKSVSDTYGKVDILFINAGVAFFAPIEGATEEHFDGMMNINFKGAFFTLSRFIPILNDHASVILLSSVNAETGMPNASVYSASKAALNSLMKVAAAELAPKHIRVNSVSPGPINTPIFAKTGMDEASLNGFAAAIIGQIPLRRFGTPEEVAKVVSFLASDDAAYVTGADYLVSGGVHMNTLVG